MRYATLLVAVLGLSAGLAWADITGKVRVIDGDTLEVGADEMLERGDMDGLAMWKRIVKAVEELQAKKRPEGASVH